MLSMNRNYQTQLQSKTAKSQSKTTTAFHTLILLDTDNT